MPTNPPKTQHTPTSDATAMISDHSAMGLSGARGGDAVGGTGPPRDCGGAGGTGGGTDESAGGFGTDP